MGGERAFVPVTSEDDPFRPPTRVAPASPTSTTDPTLSYQITEDEFISAAVRLRRPAVRAMSITGGLIVLAMVAQKLFSRGLDDRLIAQIVVFAVLVSGMMLAFRVVHRRAQRRIYRDLDMDDTVHLSVEPDGLRFETTLVTARVPWDRISRVDVTSAQILIHRTRGMAHIVPLRVFVDQSAADAFIGLLRRNTAR